MGGRRHAREIALQVLYSMDVQPDLSPEAALARFRGGFEADEDLPVAPAAPATTDDETNAFAERLVRGVHEHLAEIDARIVAASRNWRLERMARVDRNLLRLAVYEMTLASDIPPKAAINEAIEIAKRFGAQESPAFVNGILDRVLAGKR